MGETVTQPFYTVFDSCTSVAFNIFSTSTGVPASIYDDGVNEEASMSVTVPIFQGKDRPVCFRFLQRLSCTKFTRMSRVVLKLECSFSFGDTAIMVTARDLTSGDERSVSVAFSKKYV